MIIATTWTDKEFATLILVDIALLMNVQINAMTLRGADGNLMKTAATVQTLEVARYMVLS